MLLPASRTTRDVIRPAMEKIGVYVEVVEAYQTVAPAAKGENVARLLRDAGADYIVFTSPSTVANLAAILRPIIWPRISPARAWPALAP